MYEEDSDEELIPVSLGKIHETEKSYKVSSGKESVWVAKSHISDITFENNGIINCCIPTWLAEKYDFS